MRERAGRRLNGEVSALLDIERPREAGVRAVQRGERERMSGSK